MTNLLYYNLLNEKNIKIIISSFFLSFSDNINNYIDNFNNKKFILKIPGEIIHIKKYCNFIKYIMIFYSLEILYINEKLDNNNKYIEINIKPINIIDTIYFCKFIYRKLLDLMSLSIKLYFFDNIIDNNSIWWMTKDNISFLPNKFYNKIYSKKFKNSYNIFKIPFTQNNFYKFKSNYIYFLNLDIENKLSKIIYYKF